MDKWIEMAAGLLGPALDFWPLAAARRLYARREQGLAGLQEAGPEVAEAAARAISRHTLRQLVYNWLTKNK